MERENGRRVFGLVLLTMLHGFVIGFVVCWLINPNRDVAEKILYLFWGLGLFVGLLLDVCVRKDRTRLVLRNWLIILLALLSLFAYLFAPVSLGIQ